jgi:DNA-binding transcriptional regulator YiaG
MPRVIRHGSGRTNCSEVVALFVQVRTELQITQNELAKRIGFSTVTVQRWEQGNGTIGNDVVERLRAMLRPSDRRAK